MNRQPDTDAILANQKRRPRRGGSGRRKSAIRLRMEDDYDKLAAHFAKYGVDWDQLAKDAADQKMLDTFGRPPSAVAIRNAWQRVVQDRRHGIVPSELPSTIRAQSFSLSSSKKRGNK